MPSRTAWVHASGLRKRVATGIIGAMLKIDATHEVTAITRDSILNMLHSIGFGVLATQSAGQPHTSLIAITPVKNGQGLLFATYRNTRKFNNLAHNKRVSVLMDGRSRVGLCSAPTCLVLSAVGRVQDIGDAAHPALLAAHLQHHPNLLAFTQAPDCVLLEVVINAYQVVNDIDDVSWWRAQDLSAPAQIR